MEKLKHDIMYTPAKNIIALLLMNILLIILPLALILPKMKYLIEDVPKFALLAGVSIGITGLAQFIMNNLLWRYLITPNDNNKLKASFVLVLMGIGIIVLLTAMYGGAFWLLNQ